MEYGFGVTGSNGQDELAAVIGSYAVEQIRYRIGRLVGKHGFVSSDIPDIEAELVNRVWKDLQWYDPEKSSRKYFISCAINRRIVELIRQVRAEKRDCRRVEYSLNETTALHNGAPQERGQSIPDPRSSPEQTDLILDVRDAVAALSDELRDICLRLSGRSVASLAREMGMSRASMRRRVEAIRREFRRRGLEGYLPEKVRPVCETPA